MPSPDDDFVEDPFAEDETGEAPADDSIEDPFADGDAPTEPDLVGETQAEIGDIGDVPAGILDGLLMNYGGEFGEVGEGIGNVLSGAPWSADGVNPIDESSKTQLGSLGNLAGNVVSGTALGLATGGVGGIGAQAAIQGGAGAVSGYGANHSLGEAAMGGALGGVLGAGGKALSNWVAKRGVLDKALPRAHAPAGEYAPVVDAYAVDEAAVAKQLERLGDEYELRNLPISDIDVPEIWQAAKMTPIRKALEEGTPLPPIRADVGANGRYAIDDGIHRTNAAMERQMSHVPAYVPKGSATGTNPADLTGANMSWLDEMTGSVNKAEEALPPVWSEGPNSQLLSPPEMGWLAQHGKKVLDWVGGNPVRTPKKWLLAQAGKQLLPSGQKLGAMKTPDAQTVKNIMANVSGANLGIGSRIQARPDVPTLVWALQSVNASGDTSLPPDAQSRLDEALMSGDDSNVSSVYMQLSMAHPGFQKRMQREIESINNEDG